MLMVTGTPPITPRFRSGSLTTAPVEGWKEPFCPGIERSMKVVSATAKMFSATPMMNSSLLKRMTNSPKNIPNRSPTASANTSPITQLLHSQEPITAANAPATIMPSMPMFIMPA